MNVPASLRTTASYGRMSNFSSFSKTIPKEKMNSLRKYCSLTIQTGWQRIMYFSSMVLMVRKRLQNGFRGMIYSAIISKSKSLSRATPGTETMHPGGLCATTFVPGHRQIFGKRKDEWIKTAKHGAQNLRYSHVNIPCSGKKRAKNIPWIMIFLLPA